MEFRKFPVYIKPLSPFGTLQNIDRFSPFILLTLVPLSQTKRACSEFNPFDNIISLIISALGVGIPNPGSSIVTMWSESNGNSNISITYILLKEIKQKYLGFGGGGLFPGVNCQNFRNISEKH